MPKKEKKIVCIGGGTGTSTVLLGLKKYLTNLTAVVSMFDGGAGSTGKLREELNVLPPGDARQCLIALSTRPEFAELCNYRFESGTLRGHSLGNLLIATAEKFTGNFNKGLERVGKFLGAKGKVIPVTLNNCNLKAILNNGERLENEDRIVNSHNLSKTGIKELFLEPGAVANYEAVKAIKNADLVVIGPGKFYTSLIPNFLVEGIVDAIKKSRAKKVFICNLMTQPGNTDHFTVEDFVTILTKYLGEGVIDYVIFNTGKMPTVLIKKIKKIFPKADFIKYNKSLLKKRRFIGTNVINQNIRQLNPSDIFVQGANQRTMVLHDPDKLAKILIKLA